MHLLGSVVFNLMLASVDMEAVLERYSSRYSEMLAKQLLALMGRSLQGDTLT